MIYGCFFFLLLFRTQLSDVVQATFSNCSIRWPSAVNRTRAILVLLCASKINEGQTLKFASLCCQSDQGAAAVPKREKSENLKQSGSSVLT